MKRTFSKLALFLFISFAFPQTQFDAVTGLMNSVGDGITIGTQFNDGTGSAIGHVGVSRNVDMTIGTWNMTFQWGAGSTNYDTLTFNSDGTFYGPVYGWTGFVWSMDVDTLTMGTGSATYTGTYSEGVINGTMVNNSGNSGWFSMTHNSTATSFQPQTSAELQTAVDLWVSDNASALATYGEINTWDVSLITYMWTLFYNKTTFNSDISNWDVSSVTNMGNMFYNAESFNQDLSSWDVSNVIDMAYMFRDAQVFNQDISGWNVSSVTTMSRMFYSASSFNQDISNWDVSNVTTTQGLFNQASSFNQDISNWDVSSVTNMKRMFSNASSFNQDISNWDVSSVTDMSYIFDYENDLSDENKCLIHASFSQQNVN